LRTSRLFLRRTYSTRHSGFLLRDSKNSLASLLRFSTPARPLGRPNPTAPGAQFWRRKCAGFTCSAFACASGLYLSNPSSLYLPTNVTLPPACRKLRPGSNMSLAFPALILPP
jgi:hypothetical protein